MEIKRVLEQLIDKKDLTQKQARDLMELMIGGQVPASHMAALLIALRMKGETTEEIVGLVQGMRSHMTTLRTNGVVIDTCGTGGDGSGTFNISTAVALVVAGARFADGSSRRTGVRVAKHGNRAASSKCGSADVLETLGVHVMLTAEQAATVLEKVGMVFLLAPLYHAATKHIAMVRKELGVRTVFNFLGPLANPAGVTRQLIGVPNKEIAKKLAKAAAKLGYKHLLMVTSADGLDEISLFGKTHGFVVKGKTVKEITIDPKKLGFKKATTSRLQGGDTKANAAIIKSILSGEQGSKRDVVVLNSAYALVVSGKVKTVKQGITLAEKSIDTGSAEHVLKNLIKETKKYA